MKRRSFIKKAGTAGLITLVTPKGVVQAFRPHRQDPFEQAFLNPPMVSKPFTWWHWMNGHISRKGITLDLEALKRVGVGGVQCFNVGDGIPQGPVKYLSDEWNALTIHAVNEAGRLGLQFDMHNCPGWSSTGGPWITPEIGMQQVTWSQVLVGGDENISIALPRPPSLLGYYKDTYVIAYPTLAGEMGGEIASLDDWKDKANFPKKTSLKTPVLKSVMVKAGQVLSADNIVNPAQVIDITMYMDDTGTLNWKVPTGNWTVLRMGHTVIEQYNKAAPASGSGIECDKYSREAFKFHFDKVFEHLLTTFHKWTNSSKIGMLIDSYEVGLQNWTPKLPEEFKKRRSYDLISYLPALAGRLVGSADQTERFYYDLRKTHADLIAENYYGYFDELCKEHRVISYTEPYRGGPFDQIEVGSKVDISVGEFWIRGPWFLPSLKLTSSIAHVFGKRLNGLQIVGAEAYTGDPTHSKWQEYPYALKAQGDLMFTYGLNRFIFHRYAHQPHSTVKPGMTMGPHGFHFDRTNTWFEQGKQWLTYAARCQSILQRGLFQADILYFGGDDQPGDDLSRMVEFEPEPPVGYDWDRTNREGLTRISIRDNELVLPDGMTYKMLVLVPKSIMSVETLRCIKDLVLKGMVLVGNPPHTTPGLFDAEKNDSELNVIVAELWGTNSAEASKGRKYGAGVVYNQQPLGPVLQSLGIYADADFSSKSGDAIINFIHRKIEDAEVYFVANRRRVREDLNAVLRVSGMQPELWDANTGSRTPISVYKTAGKHTTIPMQIDPCGSFFIVFRKPSVSNSIVSITKEGKELISMQRFSDRRPGRYAGISNTFSVTAWVKPETDDRLDGRFMGKEISSYLFYPPKGELLYGKGHSACGMVVARNGLILCERMSGDLKSVLNVSVNLSGWTHFALVYKAGTPTLYINGKLLKTGIKSANIVHPGVGDYKQDASAWLFEGDVSKLEVFPNALTLTEIGKLASLQVPGPEGTDMVELFTGKSGVLFNQNGIYKISGDQSEKTVNIKDIPVPLILDTDWTLAFPPDHGAPEMIKLPELMSLHRHAVAGVKYFSGTAIYSKTFNVSAGWLRNGQRLFLDMGRVEVIAEVKVNGVDKGIIWKMPYSVEVTGDIKTGANTIEIKVTNLWPNRLIGDEQQPPDYEYGGVRDKLADNLSQVQLASKSGGVISKLPDWYIQDKPKPKTARVAFTTWKHFTNESPLLESGLLGPVSLRSAFHLDI